MHGIQFKLQMCTLQHVKTTIILQDDARKSFTKPQNGQTLLYQIIGWKALSIKTYKYLVCI